MISRTRMLILILGGSLVFAVYALLVVFTVGIGKKEAVQTPAASPTPSASAEATPNPVSPEEHEAEYPGHAEGGQEILRKYPVYFKLPLGTRYWRLDFDGDGLPKDGKVPLRATVYYIEEGSEESSKQKAEPFIHEYLKSIGQQPDTYTLTFSTERPHTY